MLIHTALIYPIGESHDAASVVAATTKEGVEAAVLDVLNSWDRPQPMEDEDPEDYKDKTGAIPKPYASLEEAYAANRYGFYIACQEHELDVYPRSEI